MILAALSFKNFLTLHLFDEDMKIKCEQKFKNLVTQQGTEITIDQIVGSPLSIGAVTKMAVGTGTTPVLITDTSLDAEFPGTGRQGVIVQNQQQTSVELETTWLPGQATSTALTEVGLFAITPSDYLFTRALFTGPINKGAPDTLVITWTLTMTPG